MINTRFIVALAMTLLLTICACNKKDQPANSKAETQTSVVKTESGTESDKLHEDHPRPETAVRFRARDR